MLQSLFGAGKQELTACQQKLTQLEQMFAAINRSMAVIEFDLQGNILTANENFLTVLGYRLDEIQGQHHQIFVEESERKSAAYSEFWQRLARGEFFSDTFLRVGKGGKDVYIQATYNPVLDENGQPYKVVKFAVDITEQMMIDIDKDAKLEAVSSSFAVIEFDTQGTIQQANSNFCKTLGYSFSEIQGKHHSLFIDEKDRGSAEYQAFWKGLAAGEERSGVFHRLNKSGEDVWIRAAYIPVSIGHHAPHKVIKIAVDITEQRKMDNELKSIVSEAELVLKSMAQGDLTQRVHGNYSGNLELLKNDMNQMIVSLSGALNQIHDAVSGVANSASEVSSASSDMANRTQIMARSIEETTLAIKDVNEHVTDTQQRVDEVRQSTLEQLRLLDAGKTLMERSLASMEQIKNSSEEITNIVSLIDGIAFQTNLLALNAAVEAARAGEHGRGFAVVAGEVRNLAQKSADAAKDIKRLIEQAVEQSQTGVEVVGELAHNMDDIRAKSNEVTAAVKSTEEIASIQAQKINSVSLEISNVDTAIQQNAAFVEESAATALSLADQASDVFDIVHQYKTVTQHSSHRLKVVS